MVNAHSGSTKQDIENLTEQVRTLSEVIERQQQELLGIARKQVANGMDHTGGARRVLEKQGKDIGADRPKANSLNTSHGREAGSGVSRPPDRSEPFSGGEDGAGYTAGTLADYKARKQAGSARAVRPIREGMKGNSLSAARNVRDAEDIRIVGVQDSDGSVRANEIGRGTGSTPGHTRRGHTESDEAEYVRLTTSRDADPVVVRGVTPRAVGRWRSTARRSAPTTPRRLRSSSRTVRSSTRSFGDREQEVPKMVRIVCDLCRRGPQKPETVSVSSSICRQ
jgi:hypothetical protein